MVTVRCDFVSRRELLQEAEPNMATTAAVIHDRVISTKLVTEPGKVGCDCACIRAVFRRSTYGITWRLFRWWYGPGKTIMWRHVTRW